MPRLYTDAPEAYDGFGTVTEAQTGLRTRRGPIRIVRVEDAAFSWQTMRYSSGMHLWCDAAKWTELWDLVIEREAS